MIGLTVPQIITGYQLDPGTCGFCASSQRQVVDVDQTRRPEKIFDFGAQVAWNPSREGDQWWGHLYACEQCVGLWARQIDWISPSDAVVLQRDAREWEQRGTIAEQRADALQAALDNLLTAKTAGEKLTQKEKAA